MLSSSPWLGLFLPSLVRALYGTDYGTISSSTNDRMLPIIKAAGQALGGRCSLVLLNANCLCWLKESPLSPPERGKWYCYGHWCGNQEDLR